MNSKMNAKRIIATGAAAAALGVAVLGFGVKSAFNPAAQVQCRANNAPEYPELIPLLTSDASDKTRSLGALGGVLVFGGASLVLHGYNVKRRPPEKRRFSWFGKRG